MTKTDALDSALVTLTAIAAVLVVLLDVFVWRP